MVHSDIKPANILLDDRMMAKARRGGHPGGNKNGEQSARVNACIAGRIIRPLRRIAK